MDKWILPNVTDHLQSPVELRICFDFNVIIISLYSSHSLRIIVSITSHTSFLAKWNICNMFLQYDIHTVRVYGIKVTVIQVPWNKKNRPQPSTYHDCPSFLVWSTWNSALISPNLKTEIHDALPIWSDFWTVC